MSVADVRDRGSLCSLPATELAAAIRAKEVSPVEATDAVLERIEALNPAVNAFVTVTDELARETAREAEAAVLRGDELGLLHGVPYSLKDLTSTKGIRTTYGSLLFADNVPDEDDLVAVRLREAGGVLVGKTNTPDQGCKGVTDNKLFGATSNPWALDRTPGGSSGGAGAAVAAGMAPLAEGSDFAGSIRIPASFCGVVGLKPSDGRIPVVPHVTIWHPVNFCYGPLTRTVADAALMLDVLAGPDARDPRSLADGAGDFSAVVADGPSVAGLRVAWTPDLGFAPVEPVVRETCARALATLESLGCSVEEVAVDFADSLEAYRLLNANLRAALMDGYYPARKDDLDPLLSWRVEFARGKTAADAAKAEMVQTGIYQRLWRLFEEYDLLLTPTTPTPPFPLGMDNPPEIAGTPIGTPPFEMLPLTFLFNMSGHPACSVPAGWTDDGLPVGLQIVGGWRDDAAVLRAAAAFEQAAPWAHRWPAVVEGLQ